MRLQAIEVSPILRYQSQHIKLLLHAQRLDADLGEGEEQQATAVRAHMALMAQLLALQRARLDASLAQHLAEAQVTSPFPRCKRWLCSPHHMDHDCKAKQTEWSLQGVQSVWACLPSHGHVFQGLCAAADLSNGGAGGGEALL